MIVKGACLMCRARKAKCIPATPRCLRCTDMKIDECVYVLMKKRGKGNTLKIGEACHPCRKKKRRCDAKRPCTPCSTDWGSNCVYETRVVQRVHKKLPTTTQTPPPLFKDELNLHDPPSLRVTSKDSSLSVPYIPSSDTTSTPSSTHSKLSPVSSTEHRFPESDGPDEFEPPISRERPTSEMNLVPFREESPKPHQPAKILSFSLLPSLRLPSTLHQLHTPVPFLYPEYFQVSETTSSGLDLKFRFVALLRSRRFGIYLTGPKQYAILRGDLSNAIVHPFFIHAMAAFGMHFCAGVEYSPNMIRLRARHAQRVFEQLVDVKIINDASLSVHALLSLATMALYARYPRLTRQYLTKACIALRAAGLRFVPATGYPPELTEDAHEQVVVLSQVIYLENYMFLVVDRIEPEMAARIEEGFQYELQKAYPHLFDMCPLIMRTQGVLLVRDAVLVMKLCSADEVKPDQWKRVCCELVTRLDSYSTTLLSNVQRFRRIGDSQGAEIIESSCVCCLAHLAALCDLIGRLEPNSKLEMDIVCDLSLGKLGLLVEEMRFDEYTYLDLLLRKSWERSLGAFTSRIDYLSHEEGAPLRYYREIVTAALLDIEAKLPNLFPSVLSTQLVFFDGREEGSRYPNFMLVSERESYGL